MRIDKFLNTTNVLKRRAIAQDMLKNHLIKVNDVVAKPSKDIKVGDIIELKFLNRVEKYEILAIPATKNITKNLKDTFVKKC